MYYAESVRPVSEKKFPAVACVKGWWRSVEDNTIDDNEKSAAVTAFMGIDADAQLTGNFYLTTNKETPFNRGADGAQGDKSKNCRA